MLFIFSTPELIGHLWQLRTIVFLHALVSNMLSSIALVYLLSFYVYFFTHKSTLTFSESLRPKTCPGVPLGPPPKLSDYVDDDRENADRGRTKKEEESERKRKIRFDC
jgi:hypothetical protein